METKEYSLKINHESNLVTITGITSRAVTLDFSGDVDFTKLVSELTQSIDSKMMLVPNGNNDTSNENTLKLIIETIDSIIEEYNSTVKSLVVTDDEAKSELETNIDDDSLF